MEVTDSIFERIDSMLGKKKKEDPIIDNSNFISRKDYIELISITLKYIKEQSLQINELKNTILINSNTQIENTKELNRIIKEITVPLITTNVINLINFKAKNIHSIIKKTGTGNIKEVIISTRDNFDLYLKSDNNELFNTHSSFNELSKISHLSSNILTEENDEIKTLILKNINFNKSIELSISFDGTIDILTIFCIYDIKVFK